MLPKPANTGSATNLLVIAPSGVASNSGPLMRMSGSEAATSGDSGSSEGTPAARSAAEVANGVQRMRRGYPLAFARAEKSSTSGICQQMAAIGRRSTLGY